ncbi:hypothetical protein TUM20286_55160 [Pseudomonas tohonis]|uniref:Uncharacterized protein n=1 Tax=Pseudomonas tohonis TaxID=2725477 RepID=A0ABQ4W8H3_9PSED|nr:hypothetical protein TUM20286_55160 [Pseudomonas tohonis]
MDRLSLSRFGDWYGRWPHRTEWCAPNPGIESLIIWIDSYPVFPNVASADCPSKSLDRDEIKREGEPCCIAHELFSGRYSSGPY